MKQKPKLFTKKSFQKFLKDNPDIAKSMENTRQLLAHPEKVKDIVDDIFSTPKAKKQLKEISDNISNISQNDYIG